LALDEDGLSGRSSGVNRRTLAELAAGHYQVEATLDLHRHTFAAARDRLARFLSDSRTSGQRCVLVITGTAERRRGPVLGPRLRDEVPTWLAGPLSHSLLAFAPARPADGGAGAFYVLLRNPR
jgi:DNA-nicking Smr family endonuclease